MRKTKLFRCSLALALLLGSSAAFATTCTVSSMDGTFTGYGYDEGSATAQARDACIAQTNNGQECVYAPVSCQDDDVPAPAPAYATCLVSVSGNVFEGEGYDVGQALASARDACIREYNNSQVCVSAPFTCRQ